VSGGYAPVPNVIGLTVDQARVWLSDAGFVLGPFIAVVSDQPLGTITGYFPSGPQPRGTVISPLFSALARSDAGAAYASLITSENNKKLKFMALVGLLTDAVAEITQGILSIQAGFDLDLASNAQLDVIGLWVGQPRVIQSVLIAGYFGFADDVAALPFGELSDRSIGGVFYELGAATEGTVTLNDAAYLTVLKARIARNQSNGTLATLEAALQDIFAVPARVADLGTLSLAISVAVPITLTDQALLNTLDVLPRPAGVAIGSLTYTP
jgi:hypothetical protein